MPHILTLCRFTDPDVSFKKKQINTWKKWKLGREPSWHHLVFNGGKSHRSGSATVSLSRDDFSTVAQKEVSWFKKKIKIRESNISQLKKKPHISRFFFHICSQARLSETSLLESKLTPTIPQWPFKIKKTTQKMEYFNSFISLIYTCETDVNRQWWLYWKKNLCHHPLFQKSYIQLGINHMVLS